MASLFGWLHWLFISLYVGCLKITVRGFHSIPAAFMLVLSMFWDRDGTNWPSTFFGDYWNNRLSLSSSWMGHTLCFNNKRIKRSFGTALSLFKKNRFINIFCYTLLLGLAAASYQDYNGHRPEVLFDRHVLGENTKPHKRPIPKLFQPRPKR